MNNFRWRMDWPSKLTDLLIVIIGITIAFQLNNWNDARKARQNERAYLESFRQENQDNEDILRATLSNAEDMRGDLDSLQRMLQREDFENEQIRSLSVVLLKAVTFNPTTATMDNITYSGDFKLIKDSELSRTILSTYKSFTSIEEVEELTSGYEINYVAPFFFNELNGSMYDNLGAYPEEVSKLIRLTTVEESLIQQQVRFYKQALEEMANLDSMLVAALP